ncbi:tetratricopeptide repeat protein [Fibrobacteria bacterium R8-3-H12]
MNKQFFILLLLALAAYAQERVAIINTVDDFEPSISNSDLAYLTDKLRETAVKVLPKQQYGVMTTESIIAFLGSQERMVKECKAASCLAELGRKVNADYVAQARIGRFNKNLTIKTELYSSKSGNLLGSFTGESKDVTGLLGIINKNAPNLFKEMDKRLYSVKLSTDPSGADLSFDTEFNPGCTTPCKVELPAGKIRITADLEEYETADTTVSIKQNNQSINIRLKPNFGVLVVKPAYLKGMGEDEQWSLTLNGESFYSLENKLPADKYRGELSHRCYEDISFNIAVGKGKRQVFDMAKQVRLKKSGSVPVCADGVENNNAEAYYNQGFAYIKLKGDYDQAIEYFTQAIRLKPDYVDAYNDRGIAYYYKGDYDRAIADYSQAIRLKPDYADAYKFRGDIYYDKRDHDRAIADYSQAIKLKPDFADAYYNRGNAYYRKGDYDKAIADYSQAIKLEPNDAESYGRRGNAYSNKGDYDKAIADYSQAIKLKPDYDLVYYWRGDAYGRKGDYDKAIADYSQAIKLVPDFGMAKEALEYAQRMKNKVSYNNTYYSNNNYNNNTYNKQAKRVNKQGVTPQQKTFSKAAEEKHEQTKEQSMVGYQYLYKMPFGMRWSWNWFYNTLSFRLPDFKEWSEGDSYTNFYLSNPDKIFDEYGYHYRHNGGYTDDAFEWIVGYIWHPFYWLGIFGGGGFRHTNEYRRYDIYSQEYNYSSNDKAWVYKDTKWLSANELRHTFTYELGLELDFMIFAAYISIRNFNYTGAGIGIF